MNPTTPLGSPAPRPTIRGLYGIADATAARGDPERLAAAFLDGGCRLIQLRCKGWPPDEVLRVARRLADRCRAESAVFLINDHAHLVAPAGAHGVHVGQTDGNAAELRALLGSHHILGRSTNDLAQLAAACDHADYVAYGPVWATPNAGRPKEVRGADALRQAVRLVGGRCPLVAIGGIDLDRLQEVRAAGADAWAVIGAVAGSPDPVLAVRRLLGE